MSAQLRLNLERRPDYSREGFIVSASNATAVALVDSWPGPRDGVLVLVGPAGSGKTHLASAWAARTGAKHLAPDFTERDIADGQCPMLLDDADQAQHGEAMFHLINIAARPGCALLATACTPPSQWSAEVPDLRSRLNALTIAELSPPDDALLSALLEKFFHERNIRPSEELLSYLTRRIERSAPAARTIVAKLDEAADVQGRSVSRALAKLVLEDDGADEPLDPS